MQTESKYSLMYNDKSIMENYHLYKAFTILKEERFNFLCNIPKEERKIVRDTVIDLVLCTDMAYHFDYLGKFKAKVGAGGDVDISVRENKLLVLQMALKCADLAHMAKSFPIHSRWTTLVTEEFYLQGDQEGSLKLPKSPFMDRDSENVPKSQIGFLSFLVIPMFAAWVQYAGDAYQLIPTLQSNLARWKEMAQSNQLSLLDLKIATEALIADPQY
eukprot:TRINITY_DN4675_c0_g1_i6.p1 TRINITY_DN4675_c0_g1~~TRINITY_DN4675_c0_g1_i6.p1  ORF type:complete len:216 (+),score=48.62 TRINITY_DN4675_c0_g1_i6:421-1068(+)